jgi:hypothetical protein
MTMYPEFETLSTEPGTMCGLTGSSRDNETETIPVGLLEGVQTMYDLFHMH